MKIPIIEKSHKLHTIAKKSKATETTIARMELFLIAIHAVFKAEGRFVQLRTHARGVTAFCSKNKSFMFIDLAKEFFSIVFFTGKKSIPGLTKANWINRGDNSGSKRLRIVDEIGLRRSLDFALASYEIASGDQIKRPL